MGEGVEDWVPMTAANNNENMWKKFLFEQNLKKQKMSFKIFSLPAPNKTLQYIEANINENKPIAIH